MRWEGELLFFRRDVNRMFIYFVVRDAVAAVWVVEGLIYCKM